MSKLKSAGGRGACALDLDLAHPAEIVDDVDGSAGIERYDLPAADLAQLGGDADDGRRPVGADLAVAVLDAVEALPVEHAQIRVRQGHAGQPQGVVLRRVSRDQAGDLEVVGDNDGVVGIEQDLVDIRDRDAADVDGAAGQEQVVRGVRSAVDQPQSVELGAGKENAVEAVRSEDGLEIAEACRRLGFSGFACCGREVEAAFTHELQNVVSDAAIENGAGEFGRPDLDDVVAIRRCGSELLRHDPFPLPSNASEAL